ncbi:tRNA wybutosine-synthesizing protein 5 [Anabrus simplex]|uniref:tRNA wybutosine-synthesizing protein 5 n=1 Tax=Anabrus simplex TaxID=316456 RepID=UPI0035A26254
MACGRKVAIYENVSEDEFTQHIYPKRKPALLRGVNIGSCTAKWTVDYLCEKVGGVDVKVHVAENPKMDFLNKNFVYKTLPFSELVKRASSDRHDSYFRSSSELYYLRSLGFDPRGRDVADIRKQFPDLANDIKIPQYFKEEDFFSSVFRIGSSGVQLWTHYDIMDNILIQIRGRKRMILFSPSEALNMYLIGDKSQVIDIDNPDTKLYPKFFEAERHECFMEPGDILFIPALWFHNALALDYGVAVNVFWRHLAYDFYDKKDPYGNKDLIPGSRALQMVENASKLLDTLPEEYRDFYVKRMIATLQNKYLTSK